MTVVPTTASPACSARTRPRVGLPVDALDPATVRAGSPQTSCLPLDERQGSEVGIWQLTEGG